LDVRTDKIPIYVHHNKSGGFGSVEKTTISRDII